MGLLKLELCSPKILLIDFHGTMAPTKDVFTKMFSETILSFYPEANKKEMERICVSTWGLPLHAQLEQALIALGEKKPKKK
jgi:hypothetical protein